MTDEPEFAVGDPSTGAEETAESEAAETEMLDIEEPLGPVRLSPFAIAALVLSALAIWTSGGLIFPGVTDLPWEEVVVELIAQSLPPAAVAGLALWAASRGEEEIAASEGAFGGVGFYKTARLLAIVVFALVAVGIILRFVGPDPVPIEPHFEPDLEGGIEFEGEPPELPARPAP